MASVMIQAAVVTMSSGQRADPRCTPPVLRCTEVSQQTVEMGHKRTFRQVAVMSALPPTTDSGPGNQENTL
jgi:hypothetical protein